jgi:hypothetical protein
MENQQKRTWYRLPEGKDPNVFENWEKIETSGIPGLQVPDRTCVECHADIDILAWIKFKGISFMDAVFDFQRAGMMVCPACWKSIEETGKPRPSLANKRKT